MKEIILFITALTLFILSEARPSTVPTRSELEENIHAEENHVRVRRNYGNFGSGDFWAGRMTNSQHNIGNGYKNENWVQFGNGGGTRRRNRYSGTLNIGNGKKNYNNVAFGPGWSRNYDNVNIGNGYKNTNVVTFGVDPGNDPFSGSIWND